MKRREPGIERVCHEDEMQAVEGKRHGHEAVYEGADQQMGKTFSVVCLSSSPRLIKTRYPAVSFSLEKKKGHNLL